MTDRISTGGNIDSYCTKCRLNLEHVVVAMVGGAIVKVKCKTCGSIHRFRDISAARPGSSVKKSTASRTVVSVEALWETAIEMAKGPELPYGTTNSYRAGDLISHSVFGKGVVQQVRFNKCSVLFRDKERLLATANS
jgi:hypothetical protein